MKRKALLVLSILVLFAVFTGCGGKNYQVNDAMFGNNPNTEQNELQQITIATRDTIEGDGYETAEDCVKAYVRALKKGDLPRAISTFAIETYVENYDLAAYLNRTTTYNTSVELLFTGSDPYTKYLNIVSRQNMIAKQLSYLYLANTDLEDYSRTISFNGEPYDSAYEFVDALENENWMDILSDMELGKIIALKELVSDEDRELTDRLLSGTCEYLGCDAIEPLVAELTLNGCEYYLCMDVLCYNGRWFNRTQCGVAASYLSGDLMGGGLALRED